MIDHINLIKIAKETISYTQDFISNGHPECKKVKVYTPDKLSQFVVDINPLNSKYNRITSPEYSFQSMDSLVAASELKNPLVMNFANAYYPGGGFLYGAMAQEECLCRCSTLYASINNEAAQEMYEFNQKQNDPCESDYMLLSPHVYVFNDNTGTKLEKPFWAAVVTIPAPNRNGRASLVPMDELREIMKERLRKMFCLAYQSGHKDIVLGAWGCGAFGNNTKMVASIFYELLVNEGYERLFDHICFTFLRDFEKLCIFEDKFADVKDGYNLEYVSEVIEKALPEINNETPPSNYTLDDVWTVTEYEGFYYIRFRNDFIYDTEMFRISKFDGRTEFFDWLLYAFGDKNPEESIGILSRHIFSACSENTAETIQNTIRNLFSTKHK